MSHRNVKLKDSQHGFTLVEMLITIALLAILIIIFYSGLNSLTNQYTQTQKQAGQFSDLSLSSQRIANVVRGATDFVSVGPNDMTIYAYFYPSNQYVSQVRYYLSPTKTELLADVTPLTANPPSGSLIAADKKTYTIIPNYYKISGTDLFEYLDASGNKLNLPVSDQHIIKGVNISLSVPKSEPTKDGSQDIVLNVSLRNRKTNL